MRTNWDTYLKGSQVPHHIRRNFVTRNIPLRGNLESGFLNLDWEICRVVCVIIQIKNHFKFLREAAVLSMQGSAR
jgi:hypothetical protein